MNFQIAQIFDSFLKLFQEFLCVVVNFFRNWLRMIVMRVIGKYLKVIVFDCKEGKFHDARGTVPW